MIGIEKTMAYAHLKTHALLRQFGERYYFAGVGDHIRKGKYKPSHSIGDARIGNRRFKHTENGVISVGAIFNHERRREEDARREELQWDGRPKPGDLGLDEIKKIRRRFVDAALHE